MHSIAAEGYLVVIPEMPINMAAFKPNLADEIISAYPEIAHWVIGGHSVGGTMAAQYTKNHPGQIEGLIIWLPTRPIMRTSLLLIYLSA